MAVAEQEFFPFLAEVVSDNVNVRAGQSENFGRVCQLRKGDAVVVVDKNYSWYKIQLPTNAKSYVSKKYIQFLGKNVGAVIGDKVNVRAGVGVNHAILGQLKRGEEVYILEDLNEWYSIRPIPNSHGWVSDNLLTFISKDVSAFVVKAAPAAVPVIERPKAVEMKKEVLEPAIASLSLVRSQATKSPEVTKMVVQSPPVQSASISTDDRDLIAIEGYVEPYEKEGEDEIYYKIIVNGKPACYVQGLDHMLERFKHYRVTVKGVVNHQLKSQYSHPVIVVSHIRLML